MTAAKKKSFPHTPHTSIKKNIKDTRDTSTPNTTTLPTPTTSTTTVDSSDAIKMGAPCRPPKIETRARSQRDASVPAKAIYESVCFSSPMERDNYSSWPGVAFTTTHTPPLLLGSMLRLLRACDVLIHTCDQTIFERAKQRLVRARLALPQWPAASDDRTAYVQCASDITPDLTQSLARWGRWAVLTDAAGKAVLTHAFPMTHTYCPYLSSETHGHCGPDTDLGV